MAKKRRLTDLFVVQKTVEIDDGQGAVKVLLKKMNPVDHELAFRRANAARAKIAANRYIETSDDFQEFYAQALDLSKEVLIEGIIAEKVEAETQIIMERVGDSEPWSKDEYLQGLMDAWNDDLEKRHALDPEDEEANRVFNELAKFRAAVQDEVDTYRDEIYKVYEDRDITDLAKTYTERLMRLEGDMQWIAEYRKASIWLMTYDPETGRRYFEHRHELDVLPQEVLSRLNAEVENLSVDVTEGKDLEETQPSSDLSEQPSLQEVG